MEGGKIDGGVLKCLAFFPLSLSNLIHCVSRMNEGISKATLQYPSPPFFRIGERTFCEETEEAKAGDSPEESVSGIHQYESWRKDPCEVTRAIFCYEPSIKW